MEPMTVDELINELTNLRNVNGCGGQPVYVSVNDGEYEVPVRHAQHLCTSKIVLLDDEWYGAAERRQ